MVESKSSATIDGDDYHFNLEKFPKRGCHAEISKTRLSFIQNKALGLRVLFFNYMKNMSYG